MPTPKGWKPTLKFYIIKDAKGEYRWHAKKCGRIVADSGEGYKRKAKLKQTLDSFILSIASIRYDIKDTTRTW